MIQKGKVSTVLNNGKAVTVTPYAGGMVTAPLTVPAYLIGSLGIGIPVIYSAFEDNTGIVLSRMDGAWNGSAGGSIIAYSDGDTIVIDTGTEG